MNRAWKAAMELLDVGAIRRDDPTDVARFTPAGSSYMGPGGDYAVRRIIEELARARALADELADRLRQAAAPSASRLP
ncbi:hypothetical protein [Promicromonospora sukumoe]|uniref:hypothetical protein n=1 Tax=Promicromonospora sukumoe TaxID=88382 RepID=UPI00365B7525